MSLPAFTPELPLRTLFVLNQSGKRAMLQAVGSAVLLVGFAVVAPIYIW